jgi:hypothetical protein
MVNFPEAPVYTWRTTPTHPDLRVVSLSDGPDGREGPNWAAELSVKDGNLFVPAMTLREEGGGGPLLIDVPGPRGSPAQVLAKARFKRAMDILEDLGKRRPDASSYPIRDVVEIMLGEMVDDFRVERSMCRSIRTGHIVGIISRDEWKTWDREGDSCLVTQAELLLSGEAANVVEWVHETLFSKWPEYSPKPHPLPPYNPNLWKKPEPHPCIVCEKEFDPGRYGSNVCMEPACDAVEQMVRHESAGRRKDFQKGCAVYLRPGLHRPVYGMVGTAIAVDCFEWDDPEMLADARKCLGEIREGFELLSKAMARALKYEQQQWALPINLPSPAELQGLVEKYKTLLAARLAEKEDGEEEQR